MSARGLLAVYESHADFADQFRRQRPQTINNERARWLVEETPVAPDYPAAGNRPPSARALEEAGLIGSVSQDEQELLRAVAADTNAVVLVLDMLGGSSVEVGDRNFISPQDDARSRALWRGVVQSLTRKGLLSQRDSRGEVFEITADGYRVADLLNSDQGVTNPN